MFERKKRLPSYAWTNVSMLSCVPSSRLHQSHIFTANRKPKFYMNAFTELHFAIYHMAPTEACMKKIKPIPAEHMQDCSHENACYTVDLCCDF